MVVTFEVNLTYHEEIPVFQVKGYFTAEGAGKLSAQVQSLLAGGKYKILLDFADCVAINSPGIAGLLELALLVQEDYQGMVVIFHLNNMNQKALEVSGMSCVITEAPSLQEALKLVK